MDSLLAIIFLLSLISLVMGIVRPATFSTLFKGEISRGRIAKTFGVATIISFVLFGIASDSNENSENDILSETITEDVKINDSAPETEGQRQVPDSEIIENTASESAVIQTEEVISLPVPAQTVSQRNAIRKAKSYLDFSAFSYTGLIAQLEFDQFSNTDAIYGADNSGANWNEQAARKATSYLDFSAFSRQGLIDQLKFDGFTSEQASYGVSAAGL